MEKNMYGSVEYFAEPKPNKTMGRVLFASVSLVFMVLVVNSSIEIHNQSRDIETSEGYIHECVATEKSIYKSGFQYAMDVTYFVASTGQLYTQRLPYEKVVLDRGHIGIGDKLTCYGTKDDIIIIPRHKYDTLLIPGLVMYSIISVVSLSLVCY